MGTPFKLKNGSVALLAEVPGGLYNSAHLKKLAAVSEQHSVIMKATEDQRIVMFVVPEQVESISRDLTSGGLAVRHYQDGVHQPVACIGALCPESKQDALKASLDITEGLAGIEAVAALKIGINGCASCCVPCHTLDIAIVGQEEGYRISLGGRQMIVPELASFAAEGIPASELVDKVRAVVDVWKEHGQPGERMQGVVERIGMTPFIEALAPYSGDASGNLDQILDTAPVPVEPLAQTGLEQTGSVSEVVPESITEDALESTMAASMEAEAAVPVPEDENASARNEILDALPEAVAEIAEEPIAEVAPQIDVESNVLSFGDGMVESASAPISIESLEGMEIDPSGKFVFSFGGGASITVDPAIIPFGGSRVLKFAGKELTVRADGKGFNVDVDGLTFHMPLNAA
jgi:hypothetical protein